ncbi:hypothetical protein, partial [Streptomyces sp. DSM 41029]
PAEDLEAFEEWMHGYWAGALRSIDPTYETSTECERANCQCGGTGHREEYAGIHGGRCFPCGGTGRVIGDADDDQEHDG